MSTAFDVAAFIIFLSEQTGEPVTNMKLQKLLYYSYAWYLVESNGKQLFSNEIQAWKYGPVVADVYFTYKDSGADNIKTSIKGDRDLLEKFEKKVVEDVFLEYGKLPANSLVELSHAEPPWLQTYKDGVDNIKIPDNLILEYFTSKKQQNLEYAG